MESKQKATPKENTPKKKRTVLIKLLRIFAWILGSVLFLLLLVLLLIQIPAVQNFGRKKAVSFLEGKLKTRVEIGKLDIKFPTAVSLQQVFFEDQSQDTLLFGKELRVDIKMLQLIRNNVEIEEIFLDGIVAKVKKLPPDSTFNFQFIIDAFSSENKKEPEKEDSSTLKIDIDRITVKNSHVVYDDAYSGNDMDMFIGLLDGKIDKFDPAHLLFDIPEITISGIKGHFYQLEPLEKSAEKVVAEASAADTNYLKLLNNTIKVSDIDVVFKSEPSNLYSGFQIGDLTLHPETLDLKNSIISLKNAALKNSSILVRTASAEPAEGAKDTVVVEETPPFKIIASKLSIENSNLRYDDSSIPHSPSGMDFSHLGLSNFNFNATDIRYSADTIIANVSEASFKDTSGFELNKLHTNFEMTPTGVALKDLYVETPGTVLKKAAVITYPSLESIKSDPGNLGLDIDLTESKISVRDILTFMPSLSLDGLSPTSTLYVDARILGQVNNLNMEKIILRGLSGTDIQVNGKVKGLPDTKKLFADLNIKQFKTSRSDILALVPKNTLPPDITLPQSLEASGIFRGGMENMYTDLNINSTLGGASVKGVLHQITDKQKAMYNMVLKARNVRVGTLIQNEQLGGLTADLRVKGKGLDPQTADAGFEALISDITLNKYHYKNIVANGSIANKTYAIKASVQDPNIDLDVDATGVFDGEYPGLTLEARIDSIKTLPLHFTTNEMIYHGLVKGDFKTIDPDNLNGQLYVTNSILVNDGKRLSVDSLSLIAKNDPDSQSLVLNADFLQASITGRYTLTQLGDVFQQAIDPYFEVTSKKDTTRLNPYDFSVYASIVENPTVVAFLPDLKRLDPVEMRGNFANDSGWNMSITSPYIQYGTNIINDVNLKAGTGNDSLRYKMSLKEIRLGSSMVIYATSLAGTLYDNVLSFGLNIKDEKEKDKYIIGGKVAQLVPGNYQFSISPESILLNYEQWKMHDNNVIAYKDKDIIARNFVLSQQDQLLSINSVSAQSNSPLKIDFKNFRMATLTSFVETDTLIANGLLNGGAIVKDLQTRPTFTADLSVENLSVYNDTLGNLTLKVNNEVTDIFDAAIALQGAGNDIKINGKYHMKSENSYFDFLVNIDKFQMSSLEGLSNGALKDGQGYLYGKVALNGTMDNPNIDGRIQFENTSVNVSMLNNVFKVDKEAIAIINNKGIRLNTFTIRDSDQNALIIDGAINTENFSDYAFDLRLKADKFQAINSTNKDNDLFYGKMVFSTSLTIKGSPSHPVIDGSLTVNDETDFTVVLPQDDPGLQEREGVVRFVDYSATGEDSLFMQGTAAYDSLNTTELTGYDVTINLNVVKEATFNVIVDQGNGDFLRLKGVGQITGGIDASGKVTMVGSYEIEEGAYNLTFNFIKRKFDIQKGSRIVWTGEPTSAQIDITAVYVANTAPLDLVQDQIGTENPVYFKQKLPFDVNLELGGEIMKPDITFNVVLPEEGNYNVSNAVLNVVQNKLTQLRQEPAEMNKQVFALLLLNRFVGENPFESSSGDGFDAGTFAKQSVSKLLSEQLNNLAEGLIEGVDIDFDLASREDYSTGTKQDRTDLNVGVSKRLLNDRLTVSVGSNFELEGPRQANQSQNNLAGNININYKLSKDGRYALRAYRKNDYTGTIEGYVIETGVTFVLSMDYNRFREIFVSREERRKKREIRAHNKELNREDKDKQEEQHTIQTPTKARQNENEDE